MAISSGSNVTAGCSGTWSDLPYEDWGECFWGISDMREPGLRWPRVLIGRCEIMFAITPYMAEFFSTVTASFFVVLGLMQMLCSSHSDEVADTAAAIFVVNGISAALSHGSQLRYWGQIDGISINVMALVFLYVVLLAYFPSLNRRPRVRTAVLCTIMLIMALCIVWNGHAVPDPYMWGWQWHSYIIIILGLLVLIFFTLITYSRSKWHHGKAKRMLMLGSFFITLAITFWVVEIFLPQCSGDRMIVSLHPFWHIFAAMGLNLWTCVCKFHRGLFFNFDVEIRGPIFFPRVIWTPRQKKALQKKALTRTLGSFRGAPARVLPASAPSPSAPSIVDDGVGVVPGGGNGAADVAPEGPRGRSALGSLRGRRNPINMFALRRVATRSAGSTFALGRSAAPSAPPAKVAPHRPPPAAPSAPLRSARAAPTPGCEPDDTVPTKAFKTEPPLRVAPAEGMADAKADAKADAAIPVAAQSELEVEDLVDEFVTDEIDREERLIDEELHAAGAAGDGSTTGDAQNR